MAKTKIKDKIKDFVNNVKEDIKNGVTSAVYLPLAPFLPLMKRALAKSGYNSGGDLKEVSERFFNEYIRNLGNYDYKHVEAIRKTNAGHHFNALTAANIATMVMPVIIQLLQTFRNSSDANDRRAAQESDDNASEFTKDSDDQNTNQDKSALKEYLPFLLCGLVVVGFFMFKKK